MIDVLLLGASGSIGSQTLDLLRKDRENFNLVAFSVGKQIKKVAEILADFPSVKLVCVQLEQDAEVLKNRYPNLVILYGDDGLKVITNYMKDSMVINALVGFSGLVPSIAALKNNNILCLANKESLVVGGQLIRDLVNKGNGKLFAIDSEHVSIKKMLDRVDINDVDKILITASGGAFRDLKLADLEKVTPEDALKHPTWTMGPKITIDCATMMNKGFELIEAKWLYDFPIERTEILMHDESYVHSGLLLKDGTYVADVSAPDMHNPIRWSIYQSNVKYDLVKVKSLDEFGFFHFHKFDEKRYPCVTLALEAFKKGGNAPAILNAANEIAVYAFLNKEIKFLDIYELVKIALDKMNFISSPSLEDLIKTDKKTREFITAYISENK